MPYVFCCPNCHVEHPAASAISGRRVRCPDCFELVQAAEADDLVREAPPSEKSSSDTVVISELDVAAAEGGFDPYEQWLGIPADEQPASFYRLLDLPPFEPDSYVISGAADRQVAKVEKITDEAQQPVQQRVIGEINRARQCLTDGEQKVTYDRRLLKQLHRQKRAKATAEAESADETSAKKEGGAAETSGDSAGLPGPPAAPQNHEAQSQEAQSQDAGGEETVDQLETQPLVLEEPEKADVPQPDPGAVSLTAAPPKTSPSKAAPPVAAPPVIARETAAPMQLDVPPGEEQAPDSSSVNFSGSRIKFEAEMDMTPMVDVTFLLLIFFMVTASFSLQKSIEQPVQKQDKPSTNVTMQEFEDNPDFVVVQIDEFDTFRVITAEFDEEAPSEQELLIKLRRARQGGGGQIPTKMLVAAHGDTSHGRVIMAMDAGTEVGMEQVQFTLAADGDL